MIGSLQDLIDHLQTAIQIEHATIPPYLSALWSIVPGRNRTAARVLHEVVMQEMLHMTLVANVLNGLGVTPSIYRPDFLLSYPAYLPHSNDAFEVSVGPFSPAALDNFLQIELPPKPGSPSQPDQYATIAQFYEAVVSGLQQFAKEPSVWTGAAAAQVGPNHYFYGSGGDAMIVGGCQSAVDAMAIVMWQGEGYQETIWEPNAFDTELAHYYRFNELALSRRYAPSDTPTTGPTGAPLLVDFDAVLPTKPNPKAEDYQDNPDLQAMTEQCSTTYTALLGVLQGAFGGAPHLLKDAVLAMKQVGYEAVALMNVPIGDGSGLNAGPAFEWSPPDR